MNQSFQTRFGELVGELAAVHGVFPSKELAGGFWKVLQSVEATEDECEVAFDRALREWEKWWPAATLKALVLSERSRAQKLLHPPGEAEPVPYQPEQWAKIRATLRELSESMELPPENLDAAKAEARRRLLA